VNYFNLADLTFFSLLIQSQASMRDQFRGRSRRAVSDAG
jgi:hypothetical protein